MDITVTGQDGAAKKLIVNESVMLADKFDTIQFRFLDYRFIVRFSDDGEPLTSWITSSGENYLFDITLFKWYSASYVEIRQPMVVPFVNGHKWEVVFRTQAAESEHQHLRFFHLSIWEI